jgi:hypothetical protein
LVAHLTGGQGVAGSNPVSPTIVVDEHEESVWRANREFAAQPT